MTGDIENLHLLSDVELKPRLHDTTGCQTGWTTGWATGWMFACTMQPVVQPVVQPVWQPVVSCKRGLSSTSDNKCRFSMSPVIRLTTATWLSSRALWRLQFLVYLLEVCLELQKQYRYFHSTVGSDFLSTQPWCEQQTTNISLRTALMDHDSDKILCLSVFMVALWNRAHHYIFILWFLLSI